MAKILDRKSFEVGGHWPLWRGLNNRMTTQNRQKSNAKKNQLSNSEIDMCISHTRVDQLLKMLLNDHAISFLLMWSSAIENS